MIKPPCSIFSKVASGLVSCANSCAENPNVVLNTPPKNGLTHSGSFPSIQILTVIVTAFVTPYTSGTIVATGFLSV